MEAGLVLPLPEGLRAVAVTVGGPSTSGWEGVQLHPPAPAEVAVQSTVSPSRTVSVWPTSAVPLGAGVEVARWESGAGLVMTGVATSMTQVVLQLSPSDKLPSSRLNLSPYLVEMAKGAAAFERHIIA